MTSVFPVKRFLFFSITKCLIIFLLIARCETVYLFTKLLFSRVWKLGESTYVWGYQRDHQWRFQESSLLQRSSALRFDWCFRVALDNWRSDRILNIHFKKEICIKNHKSPRRGSADIQDTFIYLSYWNAIYFRGALASQHGSCLNCSQYKYLKWSQCPPNKYSSISQSLTDFQETLAWCALWGN